MESDSVWRPNVIEHVEESQIEHYIAFARTPCIPGGGCDIEEALNILYQSHGDVKLATQRLISAQPKVDPTNDGSVQPKLEQHEPADHHATSNSSSNIRPAYLSKRHSWTMEEVHMFERSIMLHGKRFDLISRDLRHKSVKDCVRFYYLWKHAPSKRFASNSNNSPNTIRSNSLTPSIATTITNTPSTSSSTSSPISDLGSDSQLSRSNSSAQILVSIVSDGQHQQHLQLQLQQPHSQEFKQTFGQSTNQPQIISSTNGKQVFPCKVCGRVFEKIKSRSAHMKRHKNER